MIANWYGRDKLNKKGERGLNNTNRFNFNCGGYALETFNWYQPHNDGEGEDFFGFWSDVDREEVLDYTVKFMLKDFKGSLRIINEVSELREDEFAIAYRVGERDFHYAKRSDKGVWFHKTGSAPVIKRMTKEELFADNWCNDKYTSEIVLFAKKKLK